MIVFLGGAERDRTADLLVANEALSQLSYSPSPYVRRGYSRRRNALEMNSLSVAAPAAPLNYSSTWMVDQFVLVFGRGVAFSRAISHRQERDFSP